MRKLFEMDSAEEAQTALRELYTMLDRAATRHVLHPNTAARRKARLARHVRQLSA
jgi:ribosomal protein S20